MLLLTHKRMKKEILLELLGLALESKTESNGELPFKVGEKYFVRCVTHYMVGKLEEITGGFLVFSHASWIAGTGRVADFLKTGKANEIEPVEGLYRVAIGSIVDAFDWKHELFNAQK